MKKTTYLFVYSADAKKDEINKNDKWLPLDGLQWTRCLYWKKLLGRDHIRCFLNINAKLRVNFHEP